MGCDVFANGNEIACKAGDGKVIASFPDVCLTPPPPPAGPLPIPYPDSSFSKDMQNGSKTVMIKDKEVMLKDQSFYKTSPLGDEAATNGQGANVVTHVITGKTFFKAWSMDVQFEGANIPRNIDITTSNHASEPPGAAVPNPNLCAKMTGAMEEFTGMCACCKKEIHSRGAVMTFDEYYGVNETDGKGKLTKKAENARALKHLAQNKKEYGCTCEAKVLPEKPCNVFRKLPKGPGGKKNPDKVVIDREYENNKVAIQEDFGLPPAGVHQAQLLEKLGHYPDLDEERKINHLTPRDAGGCPTGEGNLQCQNTWCQACRTLDKWFGDLQK